MENARIRYKGKGFSFRGEKNRFSMPASLRKDVTTSSGGERVLCIVRHHEWNCLTGFGLSREDTFDDWLDREEERSTRLGRDFSRDALSMNFYGFETAPFDLSGRFVLADELSASGLIDQEMYLHGAGEFFTMWNPDELYKMGSDFAGPIASCRQYQADARAKRA